MPTPRRAKIQPIKASAKPSTADPNSGGAKSSVEDIALLAHSYWQARGCQGGSPDEDWLRAEQQLRANN
jgi:hypothetical protein